MDNAGVTRRNCTRDRTAAQVLVPSSPGTVVVITAFPSSFPNAAIYDISTNEFADIVHPQGYKHLLSFDLGGDAAGAAVWRYSLGDAGNSRTQTLRH
jgi:hypothetical protein